MTTSTPCGPTVISFSFFFFSRSSWRLRSRESQFVLVAVALLVGDFHAIESQRAADVHTVAHVPRELALGPVQRPSAGSQNLEFLSFVEDVLVERLAVDVALSQHLLHEGVELVARFRVGRLSWARCAMTFGWQEQRREGQQQRGTRGENDVTEPPVAGRLIRRRDSSTKGFL